MPPILTPHNDIKLNTKAPEDSLADFVESFWMVENVVDTPHEIVVVPNGRFDIIFSYSPAVPFHAMLMGLETAPKNGTILPSTTIFAVSFKLLAIEYLLDIKTASIINTAHPLPAGFWNISKDDLTDFESFCQKVSAILHSLIRPDIDNRKQQLFELIYASKGAIPVKELSERVFWSSRQINRYFNDHFGISLKAYCSIVRFKESLPHIMAGKLFPELNFTDQNHFIKEVKRLSGVVPKELAKDKNDRFLLFHSMPSE